MYKAKIPEVGRGERRKLSAILTSQKYRQTPHNIHKELSDLLKYFDFREDDIKNLDLKSRFDVLNGEIKKRFSENDIIITPGHKAGEVLYSIRFTGMYDQNYVKSSMDDYSSNNSSCVLLFGSFLSTESDTKEWGHALLVDHTNTSYLFSTWREALEYFTQNYKRVSPQFPIYEIHKGNIEEDISLWKAAFEKQFPGKKIIVVD